jgi:hypothetical protein
MQTKKAMHPRTHASKNEYGQKQAVVLCRKAVP